jgi:hypothetical protein
MTDPDFIIADLKIENKKLRELITKLLKVTDEQRDSGKKDSRHMTPIWAVKREIAAVLNPVKKKTQIEFEGI